MIAEKNAKAVLLKAKSIWQNENYPVSLPHVLVVREDMVPHIHKL